MNGVYGFNFERVEIKNRTHDRHENSVWFSSDNKYLNISKDIIEKTAFVHKDEIVLLADKKMGVFCITAAPNKDLAGSARISKQNNAARITSRDMCRSIKTISEAIGYAGNEFDAWVGFDGSILFKPKEK